MRVRMSFRKFTTAILLVSALISLSFPAVKADEKMFEIVAPQQVYAGDQFSFAIKTSNLPQYVGISFSTDSERVKKASNYAIVSIDVLPGDPYSGSIFPHYAGAMDGGLLNLKQTFLISTTIKLEIYCLLSLLRTYPAMLQTSLLEVVFMQLVQASVRSF